MNPPFHPDRPRVLAEVHARPFTPVPTPHRLLHFASRVQHEGSVTHLIADRLTDLTPLLRQVGDIDLPGWYRAATPRPTPAPRIAAMRGGSPGAAAIIIGAIARPS